MSDKYWISSIRFIVVLSILCFGAAGLLAQGSQERYRLHTSHDQMTGTWAFKLLVPEGWQVQGGIQWVPGQAVFSQMHYSVSAPDNSAVMEVLPPENYYWSNNQYTNQAMQSQGMPVAQPMSALQVLEQYFVPQYRGNLTGLRIVGRQSLQQASAAMTSAAQRIQQTNPCWAQLMSGVTVQYDVAQVDLTYSYNGTQIYERIITRVMYASNPMQAIMGWGPEQTVTFRTVAQLRQPMLKRFMIMYSSHTDNPLFLNKICQVNLMLMQTQRQMVQSIGELSQYISRTYNDISDMVSSSYQYKDAAYDRIFDNWSDATMGVNTFVSPDLEVKVPVGNEHVWRWNDTVIFSDDPGFNPNTLMQGDWQRMQQRR